MELSVVEAVVMTPVMNYDAIKTCSRNNVRTTWYEF